MKENVAFRIPVHSQKFKDSCRSYHLGRHFYRSYVKYFLGEMLMLLPRSKTRPRSMPPKFQSEEEELGVAK